MVIGAIAGIVIGLKNTSLVFAKLGIQVGSSVIKINFVMSPYNQKLYI